MKQEMIKNRDFIIVGQQAWDVEIGSNCKNIAVELSKKNRVLYVNPPLDRITILRSKHDDRILKRKRMLEGQENNLVAVGENLWNLYPDCVLESINWIKPHFLFNLINRWNNIRYSATISETADLLGFQDFILFNDNDIFKSFYLKELLKPEISIYYSRDFMLGTDYWKHHGEQLEPELIRKSDLCVANSHYLNNYCKNYNPSSFFIGQGCDLSIFTASNQHSVTNLENIPKPMIGYVGVLSASRLDIALLEFIATAKPEWSIVLIGPEDTRFEESNLHQHKNIFFLGLKDAAVLPDYIAALDVCINPQLVNEITIGNYPRKIDEYLALGKPVAAIKTEAMLMFEAYIYLANSKEMFLQQIILALTENSAEKQQERIRFALSHSWENCVAKMYSAIMNFEQVSA